jgi:hypothetical protein
MTEPRAAQPAGGQPAGAGGADGALQRAEELLERMRVKVDALERVGDGGDVDAAVDELGDIAELAKDILAEVQRARASADAGA